MSKKIVWLDILKSALWAMLGIQSDANRTRDFQGGCWWHYAVIGIILLIAFVLGLIWVVHQVLAP